MTFEAGPEWRGGAGYVEVIANTKNPQWASCLACSVPCDGARVPGRKKTGKRGIEDELRNIAGELDHRGLGDHNESYRSGDPVWGLKWLSNMFATEGCCNSTVSSWQANLVQIRSESCLKDLNFGLVQFQGYLGI